MVLGGNGRKVPAWFIVCILCSAGCFTRVVSHSFSVATIFVLQIWGANQDVDIFGTWKFSRDILSSSNVSGKGRGSLFKFCTTESNFALLNQIYDLNELWPWPFWSLKLNFYCWFTHIIWTKFYENWTMMLLVVTVLFANFNRTRLFPTNLKSILGDSLWLSDHMQSVYEWDFIFCLYTFIFLIKITCLSGRLL